MTRGYQPGYTVSPETRAAQSAAAIRRWSDPATRAAQSAALRGNLNALRTHRESRTRLYQIWNGMLQRTSNPSVSAYRYYGGKGVTVCDEWRKYEPFRDWSRANGYADDLTIDRIDPAGDYEPANCQWITSFENKSRAHRARRET